MDGYGWKIKVWSFNKDNVEAKRKEMLNWCEKWKHKYQIKEIFVNNAYAVEYKMLLHCQGISTRLVPFILENKKRARWKDAEI